MKKWINIVMETSIEMPGDIASSTNSKPIAFWKCIVGIAITFQLSRAFDDVSVSLIGLMKSVATPQATDLYSQSHAPYYFSLLAIFFGGIVSGFLVPKKKFLASIATGLPYFCLYAYQWFTAFRSGTQIIEMISGTLIVLSVIPVSFLGGLLANNYYRVDRDIDLTTRRTTIFGVLWPHIFWTPLIALSFFPSLVYTVIAYIMQFCAYLYFGIHPSLWFRPVWYLNLCIVGPIYFALSAYFSFVSFYKFWTLLQYNQKVVTGWRLVLWLIWYGGLAPAASFFLSASFCELVWKLPR